MLVNLIHFTLFLMTIYVKESSVCWYDGLSCKLNDLLVVEGSIPFSPNFYYSNLCMKICNLLIKKT